MPRDWGRAAPFHDVAIALATPTVAGWYPIPWVQAPDHRGSSAAPPELPTNLIYKRGNEKRSCQPSTCEAATNGATMAPNCVNPV